MMKNKGKKKKLSEAKVLALKKEPKKLNAFEMHVNRRKFDIVGMKLKAEKGFPGISRSRAIKKRKKTLMQEYKLKDKKNTFFDRRIGEKDTAMTQEDKIMARFTAERMKFHSKKSIYNLDDEEVLTHRGESLAEIERYDDPKSDDEFDDEEGDGKLDANFVGEAHFGGGILKKVEESKSRKSLIDQLIAESKKRKAEKQKLREETLLLTQKLDAEWKELLPLVTYSNKNDPKNDIQKDKKSEFYDMLTKQLKFEARGKPTDKLKSEKELALEARKKLETLEQERLSRLTGETVKKEIKHRSADDFDDGFLIDSSEDFILEYNKFGVPNLKLNELQECKEKDPKTKKSQKVLNKNGESESDESEEDNEGAEINSGFELSDEEDENNEERNFSEDDSMDLSDLEDLEASDNELHVDLSEVNEKIMKVISELKNKKSNSDEKSGKSSSAAVYSDDEMEIVEVNNETMKVISELKNNGNSRDKTAGKISFKEIFSDANMEIVSVNEETRKLIAELQNNQSSKDEATGKIPSSEVCSNTETEIKEQNGEILKLLSELKNKIDSKDEKNSSLEVSNDAETETMNVREEVNKDVSEVEEKDASKEEKAYEMPSAEETNDAELYNREEVNKDVSDVEEKDASKEEKAYEMSSAEETNDAESHNREEVNKDVFDVEERDGSKVEKMNEISSSEVSNDAQMEVRDARKEVIKDVSDLKNKDASKVDRFAKISTKKVGSEVEKLPYVLNIPNDYESFELRMSRADIKTQAIILDRMIKCNHPSLSDSNQNKLDTLFTFLLQYLEDSTFETTEEVTCFKILDSISPFLHDLARWNPKSCASAVLTVIKEKHRNFVKEKEKSYPGLDTLIFLKLISILFSTSDYKHKVVTPTLTFMQQILSKCSITSSIDISVGLFICTLLLEYCSFSKRFVPELLNFVRGVLRLSQSRDLKIPFLPPFHSVNTNEINLVVSDKSRSFRICKMSSNELVSENNSDEFKISAVSLGVQLLSELNNFFEGKPAAILVFETIIPLLNPDNYNVSLRNDIASLRNQITALGNKPLTRLVLERKRPKPLKLYEPRIEQIYSFKKHRPMGKAKQEREKLKHKIKRETKGALREIRKDNSFLAKLKFNDIRKSDLERQRKVREILGSVADQTGEVRKLKRKK